MGDKNNIAGSIHRRLLDRARDSHLPFNEILQRYAIERFIHRLSKSPHTDKFILKGAAMFPVWIGFGSRPTMDIDLLGKGSNSLEALADAIKEICEIESDKNDGIYFISETVQVTRITEGADYEGARAKIYGNLGNARISLQVDIAFGDVIIPGPIEVSYPAILDYPMSHLKGYTMESAIAEKFQIMVKLGTINSRMKDFYDIWALSTRFDFQGETVAEAMRKTFSNRETSIDNTPSVFDPSFARMQDKQLQWRAFKGKAKLNDAPERFEDVISAIMRFLKPPIIAIADQRKFLSKWKAPGPWS